MGYRGPDLDLRTSRAWSAASPDPAGGREAAPAPAPALASPPPGQRPLAHRGGPIWVDETLLACANHAYDVALAYRSADVRLAHLLQAMTRVDTAAAALEARGVRVVSLRRDSAVAIASEMPAGHGDPGGAPRRSPEVEDVLRLAAARASHASRPAGVDDVVQVLTELGGDLPGAELVTRHFPRASRDFWGSLGPARPAPYAAGGHLLDAPDQLNSTTAPASAQLTRGAQPEALDRGFMQRVLDRLAETERLLSERIAAVEAAVIRTPHVSQPDLQAIIGRLDIIEEAVLTRDGDNALGARLARLEQGHMDERAARAASHASLADEVANLKSALGLATQRTEEGQLSLGERLQLLASGLEQHRVDLASSLGDRIAAIESAIEAQGQKAAETHGTYRDELTEVHDALMKINSNQHTLAGAIDQWRSNDSGEIHLINTRIGAVQEDGGKRLQAIEKLCADVEALSRLLMEERSRPRGFRRWLFGTDDWIKASWRAPAAMPAPAAWRSPGAWRIRPTWRLPFKRNKAGDA